MRAHIRDTEIYFDVEGVGLVPDGTAMREKPVAFIIKKPGRALDAEAVKRFALANAPAYQHPRFVWFVDELPLASTNKLDRAMLHARAQKKISKE